MKPVDIEAKRGGAFRVEEGETFEIVDVEGGQAVDFTAFPAADPVESFSSKYTYRRTGRVRFEVGDSLYTVAGEPVLTMIDDDCGIHDLLLGPCNEWLVADYYDQEGEQGCRENLHDVLAPHGIEVSQLQEVLNLFTRVTITDHRYIDFREPPSEPGDAVEFRADRDAIVGVAPCSGESIVSDGTPTGIRIHVPSGTDVNTNF